MGNAITNLYAEKNDYDPMSNSNDESTEFEVLPTVEGYLINQVTKKRKLVDQIKEVVNEPKDTLVYIRYPLLEDDIVCYRCCYNELFDRYYYLPVFDYSLEDFWGEPDEGTEVLSVSYWEY